jgi:hypothetical protein
VTTSEDDFLAIYASLGASAKMRQLAAQVPDLGPVVQQFDNASGMSSWPTMVLAPQATLRSVTVPTPEVIRAALAGTAGASLPTVAIDVATRDSQGRPLEWSWNLDGGMWRPFTQAAPLVIADKAFAWQGKYSIGLLSRVKGDYRTTAAAPIMVPVVIDSVGPKILLDRAAWSGNELRVPAVDIVASADELQWAFGVVGDDIPGTDWQASNAIDRQTVKDLSAGGELIAVFVRDPSGNVTVASAKTGFHGAPGEGGCNCDASGDAPIGTFLVIILAGMLLVFPRGAAARTLVAPARRFVSSRAGRRTMTLGVMWIGMAAATSLVPGCSCGGKPGAQTCEVVEDCELDCPDGQIPLCFDNECICTDDVPFGRIGTHSDIAVSVNGDAIISAYAQNHGDLVVGRHPGSGRVLDTEWEFVDGVPAGPIALPNSTVRGGILDPGPDVGLYTSVAVGPDDTLMVSYYDRETGSLKFASKPPGGVWSSQIVDQGTGMAIDPELGGEQAGLYTSITSRRDNGRPGIAYLAKVSQGAGVQSAEVRFALAMTATPLSPSDWQVITVDTMTLPPADPANPDPYPLPGGVGLFIESALDAANAPVIAYYDRQNGDLKVAKWNPAGNTFAAPTVMAGANADSGWYPAVAVDSAGVVHVAYQGADHDDVFYKNSMTNAEELVDDGYRIVGTTPEGLPKPEFHFVGSDTQLVLTGNGPLVVYQDATTHEILTADKTGVMNRWLYSALAGNELEWKGAYGFYASAALGTNEVAISNWVVDQQHGDNWVEVFRVPVSPP